MPKAKEELKTLRRYARVLTLRPVKWVLNVFLLLLLFFSAQYLKTEIFYKVSNTPFSGDFIYNPYKGFTNKTLKANFHTHSKAWLRLTNGKQSPEEIFRFYKDNGYDIISISNYQKIISDYHSSSYIPVYEHGYNLGKSHQLVLNSGKTTFFDFSIVAGYNNRQQVINRLKQRGGLIALAHPSLKGGYREKDMKYLKGYDFIEVLNTYAVSDKIWDAALTNGYPAWILADDDCHDISSPELVFNNWNRISSKGSGRKEVISALKKGCFYGVRNLSHTELNFLDSCNVKDGYVNVYFSNRADIIKFISDGGAVKKVIHGSSFASYKIGNNDTYVRIEAKNGTQLICLNPLIRYNGYQLNYNNGFALINITLTIIARTLALFACLMIILFILAFNGKHVIPSFGFRRVTPLKKRKVVVLEWNHT